jgi:hypothetical protein
MELTKEQINKKYKGKYISFTSTYDYEEQTTKYEVSKTSKTIKENMTLGEDVGTKQEFCR